MLRYLRSLSINKILSTQILTLILLALASAPKCSEINHLGIRLYKKPERKFCFNVIIPTKRSTANKPLPVLQSEQCQDDSNICVFGTLE